MKWKDWDLNLKIRLIGEGATNLLFWMFFPFMSIYFSDAFGKGTAGALLVLSQVIGVVVGLFGGYAADHYGRKKMMVIAAYGQALCFIPFALGTSPWLDSALLTYIGFSLLGFFGSLYWPASQAMIADVVDEKHRSAIFAVFYTAVNIAVVIGPVLGGIFFFSYRFPFLLTCGGVALVLAVVLHRYLRETAPAVERAHDANAGWIQYAVQQLHDYQVITKDVIFLLFIVAGILVAQTFMQLDLLMAVYVTDKLPEQTLFTIGDWSFSLNGKEAFSWVVSENGLLVALFTVFMTKWMTRYKERNVFVMSAVFYGVGIFIYGHTLNIWILFFAGAIFTAAELMVAGLQNDFISKLAPEHMRGQYFAAASLRYSIGRTIAPLAIPMTAWIGYSWTFTLLAIVAFVGAALYALMFELFERKKREAGEWKDARSS